MYKAVSTGWAAGTLLVPADFHPWLLSPAFELMLLFLPILCHQLLLVWLGGQLEGEVDPCPTGRDLPAGLGESSGADVVTFSALLLHWYSLGWPCFYSSCIDQAFLI